MSDWYVSSTAYATYTAFATSHAYLVGDIIVPTAPAAQAKWVFRCTTAGTSSTEPTWPTGDGSTITSGTATFTNVTGQSTFGWTAAAGDLPTLLASSRTFTNSKIYISSDHSETQTATSTYANSSSGFCLILSVNRAGSTPPVAADLTAGATFTVGGTKNDIQFLADLGSTYFYGCSFINSASNSAGGSSPQIYFGLSVARCSLYFNTCQFWMNNSNASNFIFASFGGTPVVWENSTVRFGNVGQRIVGTNSGNSTLDWINTPNAVVGATLPTALFDGNISNAYFAVNVRGVDLSAITGSLVSDVQNSGAVYVFSNCKIASGVTRLNLTSVNTTRDLVQLVSCYDGTHFVSEVHQASGDVTTEFTTTMSGGANDNIGQFSHKMTSNANADKFVFQLNSFWLDIENTSTGSARTATVEIISSSVLNNDEIALYLEFEGTAGSSLTSFADSFAGLIVTPTPVPTSTATWNSPPATPHAQKLQVTFTPQHAGRVKAQLRLGKASTTMWYNPEVTVT